MVKMRENFYNGNLGKCGKNRENYREKCSFFRIFRAKAQRIRGGGKKIIGKREILYFLHKSEEKIANF